MPRGLKRAPTWPYLSRYYRPPPTVVPGGLGERLFYDANEDTPSLHPSNPRDVTTPRLRLGSRTRGWKRGRESERERERESGRMEEGDNRYAIVYVPGKPVARGAGPLTPGIHCLRCC
jgi:hypothetical protein